MLVNQHSTEICAGRAQKGCSPLPPPQEQFIEVYAWDSMKQMIDPIASLLGRHLPPCWEEEEQMIQHLHVLIL